MRTKAEILRARIEAIHKKRADDRARWLADRAIVHKEYVVASDIERSTIKARFPEYFGGKDILNRLYP